MAALFKQKIAPIPFGVSVQEIRTVVGSLRQRGTLPAIWLINTYWAEEMILEIDSLIGSTPCIFFHREIAAASSGMMSSINHDRDRFSAILAKMTPRPMVVWGYGTATSDAAAGKLADALIPFFQDGNFEHIERVAPRSVSFEMTLRSANAQLAAFRSAIGDSGNVPRAGSSAMAPAVGAASVKSPSTTSLPAVAASSTAAFQAVGGVPVVAKPVAPKPVSPKKAFAGTIEQLALSTLLMMLEMEKKSGELSLTRDSEHALVSIKAGRVVAAALTGGEPEGLAGAECIYQLLAWKTGNFEFSQKTIEIQDSVNASITSLLMEGARRMDEQQNA